MKCDICLYTNTYIKEYEYTYYIKGKDIKFISKRRFCSNCNNFGIPSEKIIELRNKYN